MTESEWAVALARAAAAAHFASLVRIRDDAPRDAATEGDLSRGIARGDRGDRGDLPDRSDCLERWVREAPGAYPAFR